MHMSPGQPFLASQNPDLGLKYKIMFIGYIKKTLYETRKNFFIREKKRLDVIVSLDHTEMEPFEPSFEDEFDAFLNIEDTFEDQKLFLALRQLTVKQQTILLNYYIREKNENQIAAEMKISRQAVNRTRKRALVTVKKLYEK